MEKSRLLCHGSLKGFINLYQPLSLLQLRHFLEESWNTDQVRILH